MGEEWRSPPVVSGISSSSRLIRRLAKPRGSKRRLPAQSHIKKNLNELMAADLVAISKALKSPHVHSIHLFQRYSDLQVRTKENKHFGFLGFRHSEPLYTFSRALAWALSGGGWLQHLELGFCLWERDLKILAEAISRSSTLRRLSFANSDLGDHSLQLLGKSLRECAQLEVLNLSACSLTDAVAPLVSSIIKANVCRKAQADWQASLRSSKGVTGMTMRAKGLVALDISCNKLSDISTQLICSVLRIGPPLEALNLRNNQLSRISGQLLLEVMEEWGILKSVDLRDNVDNRLMGVLEDGQHLTSFSRPQPPFWINPTSPDKSQGESVRTLAKKPKKKPEVSKDTKPMDTRQTYIHPRITISSTRTKPTSCVLTSDLHMKAEGSQRRNRKPHLSARKGVDEVGDPISNYDKIQELKKHIGLPSTFTNEASNVSTVPKGKKRKVGKLFKLSCSPSSVSSPEFTAWEHEDANGKENSLANQITKLNTSPSLPSEISEGSDIEEDNSWIEEAENKPKDLNYAARQSVFSPLNYIKREKPPFQLKKSSLSQNHNMNVRRKKYQPTINSRASSGTGSKKPKRSKGQTVIVHERNQHENKIKGNHKIEPKKIPNQMFGRCVPKSGQTPRKGMKISEWNSFLKEITEALFHLQDRLDKLIGPADPNSVTVKAAPKL